jgi:cobalamin biosynthesis protein CobT
LDHDGYMASLQIAMRTAEGSIKQTLGIPAATPLIVERLGAPQSAPVSYVEEIKRIGATARQKLLLLLQGESRVGYAKHKHYGRIDISRIAQLASGVPGRVFKLRADREAPPTCVAILLDASGSMADCCGEDKSKGIVAAATAAAITRILSSAGHRVVVYSFAGKGGKSYLTEIYATDRDRITELAHRTYTAGRFCYGSTPLGEALAAAIQRLAARPEKRKVILAVTDGIADSQALVTHALEAAGRVGIEVALIGIGYDSAVSAYGDYPTITSTTALATVAMEGLRKILRKEKRSDE